MKFILLQQYLKLTLLIILLLTIVGCTSTINCEEFNESECLDYQDTCSLCPERVVSSTISCHSTEFCKNIPLE
ncbi:hypothetical protein JXM83_05150 [Candidatus Woesearchaeota archaeon]|nr:hypothetical protein [Candidatus Woesearchaeota archaeon]